MGQTALIPAWVAPAAQAVADCHWIAHHHRGAAQVCTVLDWVTSELPTEQQAYERMNLVVRVVDLQKAQDTLAWLLGMTRIPPIELPRRNSDGSVVTVDQLVSEYMADKTGLPEQRLEAENRARTDADRYRRLAALVPH